MANVDRNSTCQICGCPYAVHQVGLLTGVRVCPPPGARADLRRRTARGRGTALDVKPIARMFELDREQLADATLAGTKAAVQVGAPNRDPRNAERVAAAVTGKPLVAPLPDDTVARARRARPPKAKPAANVPAILTEKGRRYE